VTLKQNNKGFSNKNNNDFQRKVTLKTKTTKKIIFQNMDSN